MSDKEPFDPFACFKNPNGTYNGIAFMSWMIGIPEEQIRADWERLKKEKTDAGEGDRRTGL